jgi:hypothetical protein
MCLVLLVVRKYVYNRLFKAADHMHVGGRTCTLYSIYGRNTWEGALYINIFTRKGFEECVIEETAHDIQ